MRENNKTMWKKYYSSFNTEFNLDLNRFESNKEKNHIIGAKPTF